MLSSLYIGATGMKTLSVGMNVTSNNLANCSTVGFKAQMALYADLMSQDQANPGEWNYNQRDSHVAVGQAGMGVGIDAIATKHAQGGFESTNSLTDLAINGKGYFLVQDEQNRNFYTRAGDFTLDHEGVMRTPGGLALEGINIRDKAQARTGHTYADITDTTNPTDTTNTAETLSTNETSSTESVSEEIGENGGENVSETTVEEATTSVQKPVEHWSLDALEPVNLDAFATLDAKQTTQLAITEANFSPTPKGSADDTNPYFTMLSNYDATKETALDTSHYGDSQAMTLYDAEGEAHNVTLYYDGRTGTQGGSAVEFLLADSSKAIDDTLAKGSGLLMSGVLQFSAKGELSGLSAYTPTEEGSTDLNTWASAAFSEDGLPTFSLDGQAITLDFGIRSNAGQWSNAGSAASVGQSIDLLAQMNDPQLATSASTAYANGAFQANAVQDGYAEGVLSSYTIGTNGVVVGEFSNGEKLDLWQIPLARFTSEDGLQRAGENLFTATSEAGTMDLGTPGSENYGTVLSRYIEQSNVDLANEMVTMIVTQRGFQSNSKVVTTSDELLKTAINLKR